MFFNNKFILASGSSSRYNILKKNGLSFKSILPQCNENLLKEKLLKKQTPIKKIALELARLKSKSISKIKKDNLVVGADTVINFKGTLLKKAKNTNDAKNKILSISGRSHYIYSSAVVFYNNKEVWKNTQKSTVTIRKLSENEVLEYLSKTGKEILSSVGCYQVEKLGPNIIKEIKGDFFNVMGFPLFPFLTFIKEYKINK